MLNFSQPWPPITCDKVTSPRMISWSVPGSRRQEPVAYPQKTFAPVANKRRNMLGSRIFSPPSTYTLRYEAFAQTDGMGGLNRRKNGVGAGKGAIFALSKLRQRGATGQNGWLSFTPHPAQTADGAGSAGQSSRLMRRAERQGGQRQYV